MAGLICNALYIQAYFFFKSEKFQDCKLNIMFLIQLITAAACVAMTTDLRQESQSYDSSRDKF